MPSSRDKDEGRRLLYVGMARARCHVTIIELKDVKFEIVIELDTAGQVQESQDIKPVTIKQKSTANRSVNSDVDSDQEMIDAAAAAAATKKRRRRLIQNQELPPTPKKYRLG